MTCYKPIFHRQPVPTRLFLFSRFLLRHSYSSFLQAKRFYASTFLRPDRMSETDRVPSVESPTSCIDVFFVRGPPSSLGTSLESGVPCRLPSPLDMPASRQLANGNLDQPCNRPTATSSIALRARGPRTPNVHMSANAQ